MSIRVIRGCVCLALAVVWLLAIPMTAAAQTPSRSPLIIILVPGLRAEDLTSPDCPALQQMAQEGAIGWMNCRTARVSGQTEEPEEAAYVTLGAGARATAGLYAQECSREALSRLLRDNSRLDHQVHVGLLGDLVHAAGGQITVAGNEDETVRRRAACWVAADHSGKLDGPLDDTELVPAAHSEAPYGITSDSWWEAGRNATTYPYAEPPPSASVWCFGDLARAERYAPLCVPSLAGEHRRAALRRLSNILEYIVMVPRYPGGVIEPVRFRVILLSPSSALSAASGDRLAPIVLWGPGVHPGLLTSGSTHIPGLVANTDFLPTATRMLGLATPPGLVGRPIEVSQISDRLSMLTRLRRRLGLLPAPSAPAVAPTSLEWKWLHDDWLTRSRHQAAFGGLPTVQAVIVLVTLAIGLVVGRVNGRVGVLRRIGESLPVALLWLPAALLLLPLVAPAPLWAAGLLLSASLAVPIAVAAARPASRQSLAILPLALLVAVSMLDLLTGTPLMRQAWMSYSVMEGARYYGIGNEYCGALLVAVLGTTLLLPRLPLGLLVVPLAVLAALVGWPGGGANAGGMIGLGVGFGTAGVVWWRGRLRLLDAALVLIVVALGMAAMVAWDLATASGGQTHIARALGGAPAQIALRKAELNAWLMTHSPWSLALLAACAALLWDWYRGGAREWVRPDRRRSGAFAGMLAGALALLLFNDSGVVAAAEGVTLVWSVLNVARRNASPDPAPAASQVESLAA